MKHKHAEFIHAWAEGVEIQFKTPDSSEWHDLETSYPNWTDKNEYRIKPEPLVLYVNEYPDRFGHPFLSKENAVKESQIGLIRTIKLQEVE